MVQVSGAWGACTTLLLSFPNTHQNVEELEPGAGAERSPGMPPAALTWL